MATITTTLPTTPAGTYPVITATGPSPASRPADGTAAALYTLSWLDDSGLNTVRFVGSFEEVDGFLRRLRLAMSAP